MLFVIVMSCSTNTQKALNTVYRFLIKCTFSFRWITYYLSLSFQALKVCRTATQQYMYTTKSSNIEIKIQNIILYGI